MKQKYPSLTLSDILEFFAGNNAAINPDPILDTKARLQFLKFRFNDEETNVCEQDVIIRRLSYILTLHVSDLQSFLGLESLSFEKLIELTIEDLLEANTPASWKPKLMNRHLDSFSTLFAEIPLDDETIIKLGRFESNAHIHFLPEDNRFGQEGVDAVYPRGQISDIDPEMFNKPIGGFAPDETKL